MDARIYRVFFWRGICVHSKSNSESQISFDRYPQNKHTLSLSLIMPKTQKKATLAPHKKRKEPEQEEEEQVVNEDVFPDAAEDIVVDQEEEQVPSNSNNAPVAIEDRLPPPDSKNPIHFRHCMTPDKIKQFCIHRTEPATARAKSFTDSSLVCTYQGAESFGKPERPVARKVVGPPMLMRGCVIDGVGSIYDDDENQTNADRSYYAIVTNELTDEFVKKNPEAAEKHKLNQEAHAKWLLQAANAYLELAYDIPEVQAETKAAIIDKCPREEYDSDEACRAARMKEWKFACRKSIKLATKKYKPKEDPFTLLLAKKAWMKPYDPKTANAKAGKGPVPLVNTTAAIKWPQKKIYDQLRAAGYENKLPIIRNDRGVAQEQDGAFDRMIERNAIVLPEYQFMMSSHNTAGLSIKLQLIGLHMIKQGYPSAALPIEVSTEGSEAFHRPAKRQNTGGESGYDSVMTVTTAATDNEDIVSALVGADSDNDTHDENAGSD